MKMRQQRRFQRVGVEELRYVSPVIAPHTQTAAIVVVVPDAVVDAADAISVAGVSQLALVVVC